MDSNQEEEITRIPVVQTPISPISNIEIKSYDDEDLKSDMTNVFRREMSMDLRKKIKSIIEPNIIKNLRSNLRSQTTWRKCGNFLEVVSKVILSLSAVPAFLSSVFQEQAVAFSTTSGILTTIGAMFFLLASKSQKESKERAIIASRLLRDGAGIKYDIVDISEPADNSNEQK